MTGDTGEREPTVAEREAQRAAEQEALRNVRRLTDQLEATQRSEDRLRRRGLKIAAAAIVVALVLLFAVFAERSSTQRPQQERISVPEKIELPRK